MSYLEDLSLRGDIKTFPTVSLKYFMILFFYIGDSGEHYFFPWHLKIKYKHMSYQRLLGLYQQDSGAGLEVLPMVKKMAQEE